MELHYYKQLPSTSLEAAAKAKRGAPHLYTVIAEQQSAGRGRLQRSFFSPCGGLYFSTVLRTVLPMAKYAAITPVAALAVHRAIQKICGVETQIKWVNDLLYQGRKICGILAESGTDETGVPYVILGIGINLGNTDFPPELAEIAGCIPCSDREALLREILAQISGIDGIVASGAWCEEYRRFCAVLGKCVRVIRSDSEQNATALDIMPDGALLVAYENGTKEALYGAEISLRLTQSEKN